MRNYTEHDDAARRCLHRVQPARTITGAQIAAAALGWFVLALIAGVAMRYAAYS